MQEVILSRMDNETLEQCLWRLGSFKRTKKADITWTQIASILNNDFNTVRDESVYRKRYKKLLKAATAGELDALYCEDYSEATKHNLRELEKQRIKIQDERAQYKRMLRSEAQNETILETLENAIKKAEPFAPCPLIDVNNSKAMYAMLSDVHYGMTFSSYYNKYSPEIAAKRVMNYAEELCDIGAKNHVDTIYIALLGDMISGIIHPTVRLENKCNAIQQVIEVSQLVSDYLLRLAHSFANVYVVNVSGNHSRLDLNAENALRSERLDSLIPWYCKARLSEITNIKFIENTFDETISVVEIFGKTYAAVHGDFDSDLKTSATRISHLIHRKIDYMLAAHMHVAECRIEDVGYIRNGAVVTGGDEYTSKKRLFGPATQVCLLVSARGVDAIYPVSL